ncbi:hypothetical protein GCM10009536_48680 [Streptomyces thermocarboxydus]
MEQPLGSGLYRRQVISVINHAADPNRVTPSGEGGEPDSKIECTCYKVGCGVGHAGEPGFVDYP